LPDFQREIIPNMSLSLKIRKNKDLHSKIEQIRDLQIVRFSRDLQTVRKRVLIMDFSKK